MVNFENILPKWSRDRAKQAGSANYDSDNGELELATTSASSSPTTNDEPVVASTIPDENGTDSSEKKMSISLYI